MEEIVEISKSEYLKLYNDSEILKYLYSGGVHNWDWYGDSLEDFEEALDCDDRGKITKWDKKSL